MLRSGSCCRPLQHAVHTGLTCCPAWQRKLLRCSRRRAATQNTRSKPPEIWRQMKMAVVEQCHHDGTVLSCGDEPRHAAATMHAALAAAECDCTGCKSAEQPATTTRHCLKRVLRNVGLHTGWHASPGGKIKELQTQLMASPVRQQSTFIVEIRCAGCTTADQSSHTA